jgi:hypothetical protein
MMKAMPAPLKPYDRVRVTAIRDDRFATLPIHYRRHPEVGDVAVIVHTHQADYAYEVECSDASSGETLWLDAMYIDELTGCPE